MTKIKNIKTLKNVKKAKITVRSLIASVKKKLNSKKVAAIENILEQKYLELESAKRVVKKITKQINDIEEMDIKEIDTDDFQYEDEDE